MGALSLIRCETVTIQPATAVEGMFTCHVNNESVSVGIYYPSKRYTAAALCLLLIKKMYQIYRRHIKMI